MKFSALWLLPSAAFCGPVSGVVTLLDGTPLPKAFVTMWSDTQTTKADGTFILSGQSGIATRPVHGAKFRPTLILDQGRLRVSFQGMDPSGRGEPGTVPAAGSFFARQLATPDLRVSWRGNNLVTIYLPADTSFLTIRIDTSWRSDRNIPWNPRIAYGSLRDARDGTIYRTAEIGTQTWMAENLTMTDRDGYLGTCWGAPGSECFLKGRLYGFGSALGGDTLKGGEPLPGRVRGICPSGWHLPSDSEWTALSDWVAQAGLPGESVTAKLKSTSGWALPSDQGTDLLGLHITPTGYYEGNNITTNWYGERQVAVFWTSSGSRDRPKAQWFTGNSARLAPPVTHVSQDEAYIRCLKD